MSTLPLVNYEVVEGDLFDQKDVEAWVNPWNRNFVPRFLLLPHGVSGALKKVTGPGPWRELASKGMLKTGEAVVTDGGDLEQKLIHVAGLTWYWSATEESIALSTENVVLAAKASGIRSFATPLIGAGVGGIAPERVIELMKSVLEPWETDHGGADIFVRIVHWRP